MQLEFGGRRVTVTAADLVIGSDPDAALVVEGLGVLPHHARVRLRPDGRAEIRLAAAGGLMLLNGARIGATAQVLSPGDRLVLGDQELVVLDPAAAVGAAQRLNVTMMGMPVMTPEHRPPASPATPPPAPQVPPPTPNRRVPLVVTAVVVVAVAVYLLVLRG